MRKMDEENGPEIEWQDSKTVSFCQGLQMLLPQPPCQGVTNAAAEVLYYYNKECERNTLHSFQFGNNPVMKSRSLSF